ncbi:MAG: hypothetical protein HOQ27_12315, partial [Dermatophilaceae bacterium]|nr:hypothetical protein [Dermatophilaceae bacterium]
SLLPGWARGMLGIPLPGVVSSLVARPLGHLGTAAVRWGMAGLAERRPSDSRDSRDSPDGPDSPDHPDGSGGPVGEKAAV